VTSRRVVTTWLVWVHTGTLDGPAALPNYLARGMAAYRRQEGWQDLREGR
jgi:hypothetical protein